MEIPRILNSLNSVNKVEQSWQWCEDKQIDQWTGIETPEIESHMVN